MSVTSPVVDVVWAVVMLMAHNLIAAVQGQPRYRFFFTGFTGHTLLQQIMGTCGGLVIRPKYCRQTPRVQIPVKIREELLANDIPSFVFMDYFYGPRTIGSQMYRVFTDPANELVNFVALTDEVGSWLLGLHGAVVITHELQEDDSAGFTQTIRKLLPHYLSYAQQQRFDRNLEDTPLQTTINDLSLWFELQGGSPDAVLRVSKMLQTDPAKVDVRRLFFSLMRLILQDSTTRTLEGNVRYRQSKNRTLAMYTDEKFYVPQERFTKFLAGCCKIHPSTWHITEHLTRSGLLDGVQNIDDKTCWVFTQQLAKEENLI